MRDRPNNITDLLQGNHPEIPGQITGRGVLLLIYSFTFTICFYAVNLK